MAQLRHDYLQFRAYNTEVLVMVPNNLKWIARYVREQNPPYPILSDPGSRVASTYFQIRRFFLAGTPSVFIVAPSGMICYASYQRSLTAEPDNAEPLKVLAQLA